MTLIITVIIGLNNLVLAATRIMGLTIEKPGITIVIYISISFLLTSAFFLVLYRRKLRRRNRDAHE